ncbi:Nibrin, putative [Ricinus communis]|uniref:Nibrin, putative n=2 Tax=Ricinus communis TaxID=3988 RepID=B9SIQ5_RICCO|nr:Nibrin, putative [Ricinus communis]|eukprot:XP_025014342.1 nijmegen breakage syndrome 1 protein [Ricinus communis]
MVWALFPADPLSGEDKYYIFKKGTYKVGRKGCDVIINKDKGVSRIHAEIIVDEMISLNPMKSNSDRTSRVRIRDCSKYGTFINKNLDSKEKVHEFPNKETTLKDGDMVSFGTGNATYSFSFVPLIFFVCCSGSFQVNDPLQDKVSSIGACITFQLSEECTHVIMDHQMPLKKDVIEAIVAKKPMVLQSWVELVAEKGIGSEIPSWSSYVPTLTVEGVPVKVVDSVTRANCLKGYTFLLESLNMYKFGDRLQAMLEVGGANIVFIEEFYSSNEGLDYKENFRMVCVIPQGSADKFGRFSKLSSLSRVNEVDLLYAVVSGHLDLSKLILPTVVVSSSCSTDETVVADSDEEVETMSTHATANICSEAPKFVNKVETSPIQAKVETSPVDNPCTKLEDRHVVRSMGNNIGMTAKREKVDEPESANSDIIYSQNLIIRDWQLPVRISSTNERFIDFKRFKKKQTQSGNSFNNLIPFSKYSYKDSDPGNQEMLHSMKEERKRKQMEAIAEDLFNSEKGRRRGGAGSICSLLSHR